MMRELRFKAIILLTFLLELGISGRGLSQTSFDVIPLGVYGGGNEGNLSAYLVGESGSNTFVALDAGNLKAGIDKAVRDSVFKEPGERVLRDRTKAYFISHGHLDHLAGLVINSPEDKGPKPIYGIPFTIDILKTRYFTNTSWSNFADEGEEPRLKTYIYHPIEDRGKFTFEGTPLRGQIFELSHGNPYKSSAVLVTNTAGNSILYFGDTGADRIEKTEHMEKVWSAVVPLVKSGQLKAIFIENSFDSSREEERLFGHLTPKLLNEELQNLADMAEQSDLSRLKIIITHIKPGKNRIEQIKEEWKQHNPLRATILFPKRGEKIEL